MPNGGLSPVELKKYDAPLTEIEDILKDFAKKYGFVFNHSTYHDWPCIYLMKIKKSRGREYNLLQSLGINLIDDFKIKNNYSFSVGVSTSYGIKQLLSFLPFFNKNRDVKKTWSKIIEYLALPEDKDKIDSLLNQAKQILDNFDESQLQIP